MLSNRDLARKVGSREMRLNIQLRMCSLKLIMGAKYSMKHLNQAKSTKNAFKVPRRTTEKSVEPRKTEKEKENNRTQH